MFSFGMLMRQVLHPDDPQPFGSNAMTIMRKLDRGERPPFTRTDAPPGLKELVGRCIEHAPAKRPASMWEVHRELRAILQAEQRRVAAAEAAPVPETAPPIVQEEDASCVICYENPRTHAFIPCGHLSICGVCNKNADGLHGKCPICNTQFTNIVHIYQS
jgi:hypothetical protein